MGSLLLPLRAPSMCTDVQTSPPPDFFLMEGVRLYTGYELLVVRKDKGQVVRSFKENMQFSFVVVLKEK